MTYTSSNNSATYTYIGGAANGCDSTVTLDLTILNPASSTEVVSACESFTWIDGVTYTSSNNSATYTYIGGAANGCDSTVTLNLTILSPATSTQTVSACDSFTWVDGVTYTTNNSTATFTFVGGAANGCDSTVTLNLTINTVDASVNQNGTTLTANTVNAQYQWLNCTDNYSPIVGETGQSFTATANGLYAVEVTDNGCTDTSACYTVTGIGLTEELSSSIIIYPNPADQIINVRNLSSTPIHKVEVRNQLGQTIPIDIEHREEWIIRINAAEGVYTIVIYTDRQTVVKSVVIHR